jgi:hypothetical protein
MPTLPELHRKSTRIEDEIITVRARLKIVPEWAVDYFYEDLKKLVAQLNILLEEITEYKEKLANEPL